VPLQLTPGTPLNAAGTEIAVITALPNTAVNAPPVVHGFRALPIPWNGERSRGTFDVHLEFLWARCAAATRRCRCAPRLHLTTPGRQADRTHDVQPRRGARSSTRPVEQVGDEYGRHDSSRKGPVGCATARSDTAFRERRLQCRLMPPGVGGGRSEYGFRCHPDAAGRGVAPWVGEVGAQMAPVSAKAGGNWSGEQATAEGRGRVPGAAYSQRRIDLGVDGLPDFRWPGGHVA
jgi:hypothetical protein